MPGLWFDVASGLVASGLASSQSRDVVRIRQLPYLVSAVTYTFGNLPTFRCEFAGCKLVTYTIQLKLVVVNQIVARL